MRLLTHNILACNRKGCQGGFPLQLKVDVANPAAVERKETPLDAAFVRRMVTEKVDWPAFLAAAEIVGCSLPPAYEESDLEDAMFLQAVHAALLDVHVLQGELLCPKCARVFPIEKGIPNMLLSPEEA